MDRETEVEEDETAKQRTKVRHIPKVGTKRTRMTSMRCGGSGRRREAKAEEEEEANEVGLCFALAERRRL